MSSNTWTPDALSSETFAHSGACWRIVEAQHRVSTMKLVDTGAEQHALEELIEAAKPPSPPDCRRLHYLLSTPLRYGAVYPRGSRFRRAGLTPGVFYASEAPRTAVAEMAFYRLLFFAESPDTPWPSNPAEYTAFSVKCAASKAIDLGAGRLASGKRRWTHVTDYGACQDLADQARAAGIDIILYTSVRDPEHGRNLALLSCRAFAKPKPINHQTWRIGVGEAGVLAICESPQYGLTFDRAAFALDPRIANLRWDR